MLIKEANPTPIRNEDMLVISGSSPSDHPKAKIILPKSITNKIPWLADGGSLFVTFSANLLKGISIASKIRTFSGDKKVIYFFIKMLAFNLL